MTAVTIDAAVSSSGSKLYPNPIPSVSTPTIKSPENEADILAPVDLSVLAQGEIGAPSIVASESASSVLAPPLIAGIDQPDIGAPSVKTAISNADVLAPVIITDIDQTDALAPSAITDIDQTDALAPSAITDIDQADVLAPSAITGIDQADVLAPSAITDIDQADVLAPSAITDIDQADVLAPSLITDIDQPSINTPSVVSAESASPATAPSAIADIDQPAISTPSAKTAIAQPDISAPSAITDVDQPSMAIPSLITPVSVPSNTPPFPLNHARILYDNLLVGSTVTITGGSNGDYCLIPNTADRWNFIDGEEIIFTLPENIDIDTVCIGSHNLGTNSYSVGVQYDTTTSGSFVAFKSGQSPSKDTAIMFHRLSTVSVRRLKVLCSGSGSSFIGSIYAGVAMQMQRPFFAGHTPINLSAVTDYYSSRTESGNFIGREIRSREFSTSASWNNIGDTWYRAYFQPFVESAKILPFYFAWNLDQHPTDVGYCMTSADISPSYSGTRDLFSVSFDLVGLA